MKQSRLPEELEQVTIAMLRVGEVAYTLPWAIEVDADGLDLRTLVLSAPLAPECEDCGDPATRTSSDGVALCDGCYEAMEVYWRKIGEGWDE